MEKERNSSAKSKILEYLLSYETTSKVALAKELGLSMPTVINNVNELMEQGMILEVGQLQSTGGRKAVSLSINRSYRQAVGVNITANHLGLVLVDLGGQIIRSERMRFPFTADVEYCSLLADKVKEFTKDIECELILGVGVSIPGIIDQSAKLVTKSHALGLENYSLRLLEEVLPFPVWFENDANAAMLAEDLTKSKNAIYLSLSNTLGGAICLDGKLCRGNSQRAGEFGHMILVPRGKQCYCGKYGCADAYCAASVLTDGGKLPLDIFMEQLAQGEAAASEKWETYLEYLALLVSNLRMAYDLDIVLGGEVGGYLSRYLAQIGSRVMKYNGFDRDYSYIKTCTYQSYASAVGAAKYFIYQFAEEI